MPGAVVTTLHFLHNIQMGPISSTVCSWHDFRALCNVTLELIRPIRKLRSKWSFANTTPGVLIMCCIWDSLKEGSNSISKEEFLHKHPVYKRVFIVFWCHAFSSKPFGQLTFCQHNVWYRQFWLYHLINTWWTGKYLFYVLYNNDFRIDYRY